MSKVILSIEDHLNVIPDEYNVGDSATYMCIILGWAYERKSLSDFIYKNEICTSLYQRLGEEDGMFEKFIIDCLGGQVSEECFTKDIREFVNDYITTGTFYRQTCAFFRVNNVYELPKDWSICRTFFGEIEVHYLDVKCNY